MAYLTELQVEQIKQHVLQEDDALRYKYKAKSSQYDTRKVLHAEVEHYEELGWVAGPPLKTKTPISLRKGHDRQFEDDIWCMFYNLGFRTLNADEKLVIQWGQHETEKKQLDVVAVGDDAIFVVECKSAANATKKSFKTELNEMVQYMEGMTESLRQLYGKDKRVKYIFATRNYHIVEGGEDDQRMKDNGIYHLDDNAYNYICNLIKSYQTSVIYQFYGLMFKDELINNKPITIPALKGSMGNKDYYLFSIEPSTLLKIGFVLHRTRVNDSMAPTYQRLLIPKRLKGITKFIDDGGYFPNSIILKFAEPSSDLRITFDEIHKEKDSDSIFGLLNIPNAYGIAYIIDGQHRVYGYANSNMKNKHTIPVVAFSGMESEEQLKIFMEINENQKAVSKNLRIDLEEDLFWTSSRLDSRMKALRSSTIKELSSKPGTVLYNKISIGEDSADLSSIPFDTGLSQSGLIPKAKNTKWVDESDAYLYDKNETDINKAMTEARKRIAQFVLGCYETASDKMTSEAKEEFLLSNRATYAFIVLVGSLHAYLVNSGMLSVSSTISRRNEVIAPYIEALANGLNTLPQEESTFLRGIQGQGAEKKWLLSYQNIINRVYPDYFPEDLKEWKEMRDQDLQNEGKKLKEDIRKQLRRLLFERLEQVFKSKWLSGNIAIIKNEVENRIIKSDGDREDFDLMEYDWRDYLEVSDYKDIISKNFSYPEFEEVFSINIGLPFKSKTEKLAWLNLIPEGKGKKASALTRSDINRLELINSHLAQFISE